MSPMQDIHYHSSRFGSELRASESKPILRIFLKRSIILIRSSNLNYLAPLGQFLMGAKLILGTL